MHGHFTGRGKGESKSDGEDAQKVARFLKLHIFLGTKRYDHLGSNTDDGNAR